MPHVCWGGVGERRERWKETAEGLGDERGATACYEDFCKSRHSAWIESRIAVVPGYAAIMTEDVRVLSVIGAKKGSIVRWCCESERVGGWARSQVWFCSLPTCSHSREGGAAQQRFSLLAFYNTIDFVLELMMMSLTTGCCKTSTLFAWVEAQMN